MDSNEKNGKLQGLVDHCFEIYDEIKKSDYRTKVINLIKEARKVYEQNADKATFPWPDASNVILPFETITIDNLEPRLVAGLIGKKPVVRFEMTGMQEQDQETEILQNWFEEELEETVKIENLSMGLVHDLLLEGTVYPFPRYDYDEVLRKDFEFDNQGNIVINEETKSASIVEIKDEVFRGVKTDFVPFTDVFIPDDAEIWEKTPVIRKVRPTYAELMRLEQKGAYGYMNIGPWLLKEKKETSTIPDEEKTPVQDDAGISVSYNIKESIECIECSLPYVYRDEEEDEEDQKDFTEERLIVVIAEESKVVIRVMLLREINFKNEHIIKRIRLFPEKGKAYGTPLHGKMKSIQEGASDIFNLVINLAVVSMIPWFIYGDKAGLDSEVRLVPGTGVKADNPNEVVFPKINISPNQFIDFFNIFIPFWERIGSIGDPQIGKAKEKDTTATEWLGLVQEGNIKHNYQQKTFREEFISLLRTIYDLYYQYMPIGQKFNYQGQEVQIPRQAMKRCYKFKLSGNVEMANKLIERREREDAYKMLRGDPNINPMWLAENLLKSYFPDLNTKEAIIPQIQQFIQAFMQNPELSKVVTDYLKDKQAITQEIESGREDAIKEMKSAGIS